jgi:hypothetical protein
LLCVFARVTVLCMTGIQGTTPQPILALLLLAVVACDPTGVDPTSELAAGPRQEPLLEARAGADLTLPDAPPSAVTAAPLPAAFCSINVNGALKDTETDYIPRVITCENGGAKLEALKAQAIAARSVAYYAMAENGQICDGQGCQVYTCGAQPQAIHYQAAAETAGMYLSFNNTQKGRVLTYAFYVAGDSNQSAACEGVNPNQATEKYVTYNEGKTWTGVQETTLGFQFKDPSAYGYGQNRGCMGQWSARCLENNKGYDYKEILRYFYGADIEIQTAQGPCVGPQNSTPEGAIEPGGCDAIVGWAQDPDIPEASIDVTIAFDGAIDDEAAVKVRGTAELPRPDLCEMLGSCDHGFAQPIPRSLRDGQPHAIHAYAHDDADDAAVPLMGSPQQLMCAPPPLPDGVRRRVPSIEALAAWGIEPFWDVARLDEATLQSVPAWQMIDEAPALVRAEGSEELWLIDVGLRRLVTPTAAAVWGFSAEQAAVWEPGELAAIELGTPVRELIFAIRGESPDVDVLDDLNCPSGGIEGDPLCPIDAPETSSTGSMGSTSGDPDPETGGQTGSSSGDTSGTESAGEGSGQGLPPGYGATGGQSEDEGCACASGDRGARGLLWLALPWFVRRRRRGAARAV